jgi:hypothetical protein
MGGGLSLGRSLLPVALAAANGMPDLPQAPRLEQWSASPAPKRLRVGGVDRHSLMAPEALAGRFAKLDCGGQASEVWDHQSALGCGLPGNNNRQTVEMDQAVSLGLIAESMALWGRVRKG